MSSIFQFELEPLNSIPGLGDQIPPHEALDIPTYPPELQDFENDLDDLRAAQKKLDASWEESAEEGKEEFREELEIFKRKLDRMKKTYEQFIQENIRSR